jgi:hypothetical protein
MLVNGNFSINGVKAAELEAVDSYGIVVVPERFWLGGLSHGGLLP